MIDFTNTAVAFQHKSNRDLQRTALLFRLMSNNLLVDLGSNATLLALKMRLPIKGMIKKTIFQQFVGGATLEECRKTIYELEQFGVDTVLDYGAEGKHDEASFDVTVRELTAAIKFASKQKTVPVVTGKITGLASFDLLMKIASGQPLTQQEQNAQHRAEQRLDGLCQIAHDTGVALFIDGEESWIQAPIDEMTLAMMEKYNKERVTVYNTYQLYRHDRLAFLKENYQRAQEKGFILGAKLVRGAYMEKERERAKKMGYASPIQPTKEAQMLIIMLL